MDYQDIIYTKEQGIASITLNRPDNRNAYSPGMREGIHEAIEDAAKDDEVKVLVITGAGRAFCSGADVKSMAEQLGQSAREEKGRRPETEQVQRPILLQRFKKPIIASINGVAVGGGLDFACACDIRIASDKARFAELNIRRGIIPATGGTFFLPRLVGIDKACQLIWTGDMIDAGEAERIGLVTMVVPHEELESATRDLAEKITKGPQLAIQNGKRAIYEGMEMDLKSALEQVIAVHGELLKTDDHKEGTTAFVEKREPVFKGK